MKNNIKYLKKQIIYRCSYSGTRETDIIYEKFIIKKINSFNLLELNLILELLEKNTDKENYLILTNQKIFDKKFSKLITKMIS